MRLNKIHLGPVYSYLILIFIRNSVRRKFHFFNDDQRDRETSQLLLTATLYPSFRRRLLHVSVTRALSRHCVLRYFPARVCSVNLRLLTHTTPLFCFFYFKLFFSKTLGLVVIYIYRRPFRPSQPTKLY